MEKEKLYHQIALSCLKVLKNPAAAGAQKDQIQAVYEAIDEAFSQQLVLLSSELEDCKQRLHMITELDESEYNLADAQAIAAGNKTAH